MDRFINKEAALHVFSGSLIKKNPILYFSDSTSR